MLEGGALGRAAVPSGASTGEHEARRAARRRRQRATAARACSRRSRNVNETDRRRALSGMDAFDQSALDARADRARRHAQQGQARRQRDARRLAGGGQARPPRRSSMPLYRHLGGAHARTAAGAADERAERRRARGQQRRPAGVHDRAARRALVPRGAALGRRGVPRAGRACSRSAGSRPRSATRAASRRNLDSNEEALQVLVEAIEKAGYQPGRADRRWRSTRRRASSTRTGDYVLAGEGGRALTAARAGRLLRGPVPTATRSSASRTAWPRTTGTAGRLLTQRLGDRIQLVGDDLFVTNVDAARARHPRAASRIRS